MKLVLNIFTWCVMFIVILWTLGACTPKFAPVSRGVYMTRAMEFDARTAPYVRTSRYQNCYAEFMAFLYKNCKPLVGNGNDDEYWGCCDVALDDMVECFDE